MIKKVLIANRGEIAVRIAKTCRRLGYATVGVYSDADSNAVHVKATDEAYHLGESESSKSYLDIQKILRVAQRSGANAIHPGYGFLAENAEFAKACREAGLFFIGPTVEAIQSMGLKAESKKIAEKENVPQVPGYYGEDQSFKTFKNEAKKIGFPVLLKASAGGGGKGMKVVHSENEMQDSFDSAKREATSAFGNDRLLIEKFVKNSKHIEVQVFGDNHGNVVHLGERECSLQRRYQKIIEEAPSPIMTSELREKMTSAAVTLSKGIGYQGAGTVEFLYDVDSKNFYFMEMNTRLQVEHPVTEEVTGVDLVEWQLKIAEGERLPLKQEEIQMSGHAIECRIYAENPSQNFAPATGILRDVVWPDSDIARVETGIEKESEISIYYDPMCAKIISKGKDRKETIRKMQMALRQTCLLGTQTNTDYLLHLLGIESFQEGSYTTSTCSDLNYSKVSGSLSVGMAIYWLESHDLPESTNSWSFVPTGWSNMPVKGRPFQFELNGNEFDVKVHRKSDNSASFFFEGKEFNCKLIGKSASDLEFEVDGKREKLLYVSHVDTLTEDRDFFVWSSEFGHDYGQLRSSFWGLSDLAKNGGHVATMPGKVVQVFVEEGQRVEKGDRLLVLESMKMENDLNAEQAGVVKEVFVKVSDLVEGGKPLVFISEE